MSKEAVEKKSIGISPVWTLPILALSLCVWLLYENYQNAGVEITVYFEDASGITPGKTQVMSMGIPVGLVLQMEPELEKNRVKTTVRMEREVEEFLVEDTIFWVVRPEISAAKIYGLETIFSGSYLGIQPGSSSIVSHSFEGLSSPPAVSENSPGLHFFLVADALQSIQEGSGIYYKNIKIGSVQSYTLQQSDATILMRCFIEEQYGHLVKSSSIFSNASGITVSGKLTNLKFRMESLASLVMGGVLLQTPEDALEERGVENGTTFPLYPDLEAANYGLPMTLKLASGEGIIEGVTKVMYRGIEAGFVKSISINDDPKRSVTASILLDPRAEIILRQTTQFWLAGPEIGAGGVKNINTLFSGPYITFKLGDGQFRDHFEILPEPPPLEPLRPGRSFTLSLDTPATLVAGSPVLYKNVKVGEIIDVSFRPDTPDLQARFYIYQEYLNSLSENSVFFNLSGIHLQASLKGIEMNTGSVASILHGGVAFITPEIEHSRPHVPPVSGTSFLLHENEQQARSTSSALLPKGRSFQIQTADLGSISVKSPILYKKVKVGEVTGYHLKGDNVVIDCFIKEEFQHHLQNNSLFYNLSGISLTGGLDGITLETGSLDSVINGGIGLINPASTTSPGKIKRLYTLYGSKEAALNRDSVTIEVLFAETDGIKVGSPVKYKGVVVGKVKAISLDDLPRVHATLWVNKKVEKLFVETTKIWIAATEIDYSGISNLDTIFFGPYITFEPGTGQLQKTFNGALTAPRPSLTRTGGLNIVVETKHLGSLTVEAPVYYRQVEVGEITGFELDETFQNVLVYLNIEARYAPIIREGTKFWNVSGARFEGGIFSGITVKTESIETIMRGGIAFATPDMASSGGPVLDGHTFILHDDYEKNWLDWEPDIIVLEQKDQKRLLSR